MQRAAGGSAEPGMSRRYRMRQKLVARGDDYYIENALGQRVYFIDNKSFRVWEHLAFKDMQGNELIALQERVLPIKDIYGIYRHGEVLATVKKTLIAPQCQRFDIHIAGGENLEAQGKILEYEYEIREGSRKVADVSKQWFRGGDSYGVDIVPGIDEILLLACTVVIDMMAEGTERVHTHIQPPGG